MAQAVARYPGPWRAAPLTDRPAAGEARGVYSPARPDREIGQVVEATPELARDAIASAHAAREAWEQVAVEKRAGMLERLADGLEDDMAQLVALCAHEAGKTLADGVADVREAVASAATTRRRRGGCSRRGS
jgi:RHH-type proline utilization regulon transcriptional repressor/proline dehydrogenase/delta 1-pyrroline-5-carboxylate dehydrogenase